MRWIKFLAALTVTLLLIMAGNRHGVGSSSLPAMGRLLSPFEGFWQQAEPVAGGPPQLTLQVPGMAGRILLDERQVPHIFADDLTDAYFLQGYITARHRLWQMDIVTRSAAGRLSEVMGERTLEHDRLQRRKGITRIARQALQDWQQHREESKLLDAYTAGVNYYISQLSPSDYPLEFKLLGYEPEPWTPLKSALFYMNMAEILASRANDVPSSLTRAALGDTLYARLYPDYNPRESPIIPAGTPYDFEPVAVPEAADSSLLLEFLPDTLPPQTPEGIGSNNWALAPGRTAAGHPLLANDPHLPLTLPSIWYELQIHTSGLNVYGVSLPGIPGIIIGFNEQIAWGVTNVGQDLMDWYAVQWTDEEMNYYLLDGQRQPVEIATDTILIRGREAERIETRYTVWGPVVFDTLDSPYRGLARYWVVQDPARPSEFGPLGTYLTLMTGRNYADYRRALTGYEAPPQNFVFADRSGDIAMTVNGRFPLRREGQGAFVQNGALSVNRITDFIPPDQVPAVRNPERGFVASANQRSTDQSYPYYYLGGFDDYRGRYINRRLSEMRGATPEDMMALQNDNYSLLAEEALPVLLQAMEGQKPEATAGRMLQELRDWDYRFEPGDRAPALFDHWLDSVYTFTLDEIYRHENRESLLYPETWPLLDLMVQDPGHVIFDDRATPARETAEDIIRRAFDRMAGAMAGDYANPEWNWDEEKGSFIPHIGRIPAFGSGRIRIGGYHQSPNAVQQSTGPSWRMIVQLGEQGPRAWGVIPGGQSGNPGSPWYLTGIDKWAAGRYFELHLLPDAEQPAIPILQEILFTGK